MSKKTQKTSTHSVQFIADFPVSAIVADQKFNISRLPEEYDPEHPRMAALVQSIKLGGFSPDEPLLVSIMPDKERTLEEGLIDGECVWLDAGFMRLTAAKLAGVKYVPVFAYQASGEDDPIRRERNATENAYSAPTWQGQSAVALALRSAGLTNKQAASRMVCTEDHVRLLARTRLAIDELVKREIVPSEEVSQLTLAIAKELVQFPDKPSEQCKKTVVEAWNYYTKNGKLPDREPKSGGRGSSGADGGDWNKKKGLSELSVKKDEIGPFPWVDFSQVFPPKSKTCLECCLDILSQWKNGGYTDENVKDGRFINDPRVEGSLPAQEPQIA